MNGMSEIETSLGALRRKRGLSAIRLAATVGVSRQTIYAMEAGTYVPNTAVALRLAKALETTVEELFTLPGNDPAPELRSERAVLLPAPPTCRKARACSCAAWKNGSWLPRRRPFRGRSRPPTP